MARMAQPNRARTAPAPFRRLALRRRPLLAMTGVALTALLAPALQAPSQRLVWNASASLPVGLYRIEPGAVVRTGDIALVRPTSALESFMAERRYVERNVPLLKPVAAVAGAAVCRTARSVTIDGRDVAAALPDDRFGRPLPSWSGCRRLGAQELFLIAPDSAASFDSRYFGPVTRAQVIGRALPVWTWR